MTAILRGLCFSGERITYRIPTIVFLLFSGLKQFLRTVKVRRIFHLSDMISRARKLTTAWLGLFAMLLIVLAPLVSQLIVAHRAEQPEAVLCSVAATGAANSHGTQEGILSACGYCDLLATHVAVPTLPTVSLPLLTLVIVASVTDRFTRFTPLGAFPSGRPRAPPSLL
jgi:hypothetical protein